ncbi:MAG TPA: glycosyltransferase family 4 protein [Solirubrobacter sp.]|nr:glycosyltransferase family 4 protein [Solirubrobacter sp.]
MSGSSHRLVCVTTSASMGGAETSLVTLVAALRTLEPAWTVSVIAPSTGPLLDRCRTLGASACVVPYPSALAALGETAAVTGPRLSASRAVFVAKGVKAAVTAPPYFRRLRAMFREMESTIVHSNGVKAHIAAAVAAPRAARLVWHLHDYVQPRPVTAALLRRLARRADAIVANSDSVRRDAAGALGASRPIRRVYNAVDLERFTPAGAALDLASLADLPRDEGLLRIGLIAAFARWKGHAVFIEALSRMQHRDSVRAYIIGGPVYETAGSQWSIAELKESAAAHGLRRLVGFTGHIHDVPAALRSLDIVVHASTEPEPFGMAIAEAMASGRAVVAARAGGASELFDDGVNAVGHVPGDAGDLAAKLDELVADRSRRAALGAAAREAACCRFDPRRMAAEFREAYFG